MSDFGWSPGEWDATPEPGTRRLPRDFKSWRPERQAKIRREVEEENALHDELMVRAEPEEVFRADDPRRAKLVSDYRPLALKLVKGRTWRGDRVDVVSVAYLALAEAARAFDLDRDPEVKAFGAYASLRIRGAIADAIRYEREADQPAPAWELERLDAYARGLDVRTPVGQAKLPTAVPRERLDGWSYDDFFLRRDADAWRRAMRNPRRVLVAGVEFVKAECGLTYGSGHRHTPYCAGPRVLLRLSRP